MSRFGLAWVVSISMGFVLLGCGDDDRGGDRDAGPRTDGGGMDAFVPGADTGPPRQECDGTPPYCRMLDNEENCNEVMGCGWSQCAGFVFACKDLRGETNCDAVDGCTWDGSVCTGTSVPCHEINDPTLCGTQTGCTWSGAAAFCRGLEVPCASLREPCTRQPGCRTWTPPPPDAGPVDSGPRDAWVPMCDPDGGVPTGCTTPTPPSPLEGCNPEGGIECDGHWTGTNPDTGAEYCSPACGGDQCCIPRDGRFQCFARNGDGSCPASDIFIDADRVAASITIQDGTFAADSCEIAEGCVDAPGGRRLLRFDTWTPNVGGADLYLGTPRMGAGSPFTFSPCHGHYHFDSYAQYELLSADACCVAATGHKQAFCLIDLARYDESIGTDTGRYDCGFQGISRGWQDIYSSGLDCQYVDITDVPPGEYILRIRVNVDHILLEQNYDNNEINVAVTIP